MGPLPQRDPKSIQLKEAGRALARRVFYLKQPLPLMKANAYIVKHLLLIPDQKKELESDLKPDKFLKPLEKGASFKAAFDFRNKMKTQRRSKKLLT